METKVLEIIKDESEKADVRKHTCINGFGYSQFERNIAERVVKLFAIQRVTNWRFWNDNRNNRIVGFVIGLITGIAIYACL
jgi:hypothetical protein